MSNTAPPGTAETRAAYFRELTTHIETRTFHLRELSEHMHALEWVDASLAKVEKEVFELDTAMSVYLRFTGGTDDSTTPSEEAPAMASKASPATREDIRALSVRMDVLRSRFNDAPASGPAPTFSQFASTHLDPAGSENAGGDRPLETVSQDPSGARPSWLAPQSGWSAKPASP
jgi:hypothetical protein